MKIIKTTAQKPGSELVYKNAAGRIQVTNLAEIPEKIDLLVEEQKIDQLHIDIFGGFITLPTDDWLRLAEKIQKLD